MELNGLIEWNDGMELEWNGMEWIIEWNRMEWNDRMEWNGLD